MARYQIRPKQSVTFVKPEVNQQALLEAFFISYLTVNVAGRYVRLADIAAPTDCKTHQILFGIFVGLLLPEYPDGTYRR